MVGVTQQKMYKAMPEGHVDDDKWVEFVVPCYGYDHYGFSLYQCKPTKQVVDLTSQPS